MIRIRTLAAFAAPGLLLCLLALAARPGHAQSPAPRCADSDLVAQDPTMLNRQLGAECRHIESVRAWEEAWRHFWGTEGYPVNRPAALASLLRAEQLTRSHPEGTLGKRRWRFANQEAAMMLLYGGRGVRRDLAEARRMIARDPNNHLLLAEIDGMIAAQAEADRAPPASPMRPGRWTTRLWREGRDEVEEETSCNTREDLETVMTQGPKGETCVWLGLSRSPTRVDSRWRCRYDRNEGNRLVTEIGNHRLEIDISPDRVELTRTESFGEQYAPPSTRVERGTAIRLGDC